MYYFNKACNIAKLSDFDRVHVGCIAVYHKSIIGYGCNMNKTHPIQEYYNRYRNPHNFYCRYLPSKLHAEINCINTIKNLNINFAKVKLYICRIRLDQDFGLARPCQSCMAAIIDLGIKNIYYTTNNGYAYEYITCS